MGGSIEAPTLMWVPENLRRRPRSLSSITWGNTGRSLGVMFPDGQTTDLNTRILPFPGNPDTIPGAWPGLVQGPQSPGLTVTPLPLQVPAVSSSPANPVIVTPTSGAIPPPQTVAAATAAPVSWLEQELITGIANKWLLLAGIGIAIAFGGKKP